MYGSINDKSLGVVYETKLQYEQRVGQKGMDMYKEQHLGCAFFKSFISSDATDEEVIEAAKRARFTESRSFAQGGTITYNFRLN